METTGISTLEWTWTRGNWGCGARRWVLVQAGGVAPPRWARRWWQKRRMLANEFGPPPTPPRHEFRPWAGWDIWEALGY